MRLPACGEHRSTSRRFAAGVPRCAEPSLYPQTKSHWGKISDKPKSIAEPWVHCGSAGGNCEVRGTPVIEVIAGLETLLKEIDA